jgi:hypothetical protein
MFGSFLMVLKKIPSPTPKLISASGNFIFKAAIEGAAEIKSPTPPINPTKIEFGALHEWGIPSHFFNAIGIIT